MASDGRGFPHHLQAQFVLAASLVLLVITPDANGAPTAGPSVGLSSAAQQGAFNIGSARAALDRAVDPVVGDVLKLDYTIPSGTTAGVWAREFPGGLDPEAAEVVRIGTRVEASEPGLPVSGLVEIKGTAGVQRIPVNLGPGWTYREVFVDWPTIGRVTEVVVSIRPERETAAGVAYLDVRFHRLTPLSRISTSPVGRIGGVLLVALLSAASAALLWRVGSRQRREGGLSLTPPAAERVRPQGLGRDFVHGVGVILIVGLAIGVYLLGGQGPLEAGWAALGIAVAGTAVSEWLKWGLTGRHLTPTQVFRDTLATGLPAASASPLPLLHVPSNWSDLLLLSQTAAAAVVLVHHTANLGRLSASSRHVSGTIAALVVAAPYLFGGLLLLRSEGLLRDLSPAVLSDWPATALFLDRVAVVFFFNAAVANGLSGVTRRTLLWMARDYLPLLAVAVAVVAAPWVAAAGSGEAVACLAGLPRMAAAIISAALSQAGLWAEVYLITGLALDALHGKQPSSRTVQDPVRGVTRGSILRYPLVGAKKGAIFSATFMAIVHVPGLIWDMPVARSLATDYPLPLAVLAGALTFPLLKTVAETFDGSQGFFQRIAMSYRTPVLYARGVVGGLGLGYAAAAGMASEGMGTRVWYGLAVGAVAFAGVNLVRDLILVYFGRGRLQPGRVYLVHAFLGGFVGAALGFYFDTTQVSVIGSKFQRYLAVDTTPEPFGVYMFLSKWGFVDLGETTGGVSLLLAEALAGVIEWSVPAWLFAINRTFLEAYFRRDAWPVRALYTRDGLVGLAGLMITVLRWGLWMSPVIKSFLRPMGEPTWYNQDGAVRTVLAMIQDATTGRDEFRAWSLQVFVALLAYDGVRIAIWLDHMGLRVATLVNLSFLGMDRLDERLARFLSPASTSHCIPEAVKRFTTWTPLLIPYYIPRGPDWDYAWNRSQAIRQDGGEGWTSHFLALPLSVQLLIVAAAIAASTTFFISSRLLRRWLGWGPRCDRWLSNTAYEVTVTQEGAVFSHVAASGFDVSRRSYDLRDPAGRALFLVDPDGNGVGAPRAWPVVGNFPAELGEPARVAQGEDSLTIWKDANGLRSSVEITLPGTRDAAELWTVTIENPTDNPRTVGVVPYLEWVLNKPAADRGHTQYNRLFAKVGYVRGLHSVLAWDEHTRGAGVLASDLAPDGFLSVRVDFIGRARSVWAPRALETLAFEQGADAPLRGTFDPIGSLLVWLTAPPRGSARVRFLIGFADSRGNAVSLVERYLPGLGPGAGSTVSLRTLCNPVGHGEAPPGTARPYFAFAEDGRRLVIRTPFTPRPWDHTMSNALGQAVTVTNRGLHTTCNHNAQQNRLTPDWPDTVTRELPGEAIYIYDPDTHEWYSPTYHPLNNPEDESESEFGVDGTATFRMSGRDLETELTVFVPPHEPASVYLLTLRNRSRTPRRLRVVPYFQMVLGEQPESAGPLLVREDAGLNAVFYTNTVNRYRRGPAFVASSSPVRQVETRRGRFFGIGRGVAHPAFVRHGESDLTETGDDRPVAALLTLVELPPLGAASFVVILGQADDRRQAEAVIHKLLIPGAAQAMLTETRRWWLRLLDAVRVRTGNPTFDWYLDWLKYQTLAERLWARRGFYQASGAYGFRDQLQDAVSLLWVDSKLARRQILLHAAHQFREGDVAHWFHLLHDKRTGVVGRTYASDTLIWLPWAVVEYLAATGDDSVLDERTPYLESEQPLLPLPAGKGGKGFDPLRSPHEGSIYLHCMLAIDLVLDRRMGVHGLPLMLCGDWNDGLDEIGSEGKGESVWLGFFLLYVLDRMAGAVGRREGVEREEYYRTRARNLRDALEATWRNDRYLRAIHDDGTEIGLAGSGVWEIDALTAAWAVMAGMDPERSRVGFDTAVRILERETTILLGHPPLRKDTRPYLGRSSWYPEGVRENGMYCHGVQWLVGAARVLADQFEREGNSDEARRYRESAYRLWLKISPLPHTAPDEIETYGGQPNKQAADMVTTFDPGRMIWSGYTGAAGWMFRQALEGVLGLRLVGGTVVHPIGPPPDEIGTLEVFRRPTGAPDGRESR